MQPGVLTAALARACALSRKRTVGRARATSDITAQHGNGNNNNRHDFLAYPRSVSYISRVAPVSGRLTHSASLPPPMRASRRFPWESQGIGGAIFVFLRADSMFTVNESIARLQTGFVLAVRLCVERVVVIVNKPDGTMVCQNYIP